MATSPSLAAASAGPPRAPPVGGGPDNGSGTHPLGGPDGGNNELGRNIESNNQNNMTANTDIQKQAEQLTNAWNKRLEIGSKTPILDCFPSMTNKHAVTIPAVENISTEDVCRALATLIQPQHIVACGKINGSILVYVKQEGRIPYICASGLNIKDQHIPVTPLVKPSKKVIDIQEHF